MSKALLVASIVAGVAAFAGSATAEPFGAARSREGGVQPSPRAQAAQERQDLWEGRERLAEQRRRHRHRQAYPAGQNAGGYPGQNGGYNYGNGGGYSGDYDNPPHRPAPHSISSPATPVPPSSTSRISMSRCVNRRKSAAASAMFTKTAWDSASSW